MAKLQAMKNDPEIPVNNRDFLVNWYKNRVIPDKNIQAAFDKDKPLLMDKINNYPATKIVDSFSSGNSGKSNYVNGQYDPINKLILMKKDAPSWVETHEGNHAINDIDSYTRTVHNDIINNEIIPKKQAQGVYKDKYEYFTNPDEVHSRIMVLRQAAGIKPDQVVTPEYLDDFMKNYKWDNSNINDLLNLSKGKEGLLNMLNYMAANKLKNNSSWV
jgi:hypothetical protein